MATLITKYAAGGSAVGVGGGDGTAVGSTTTVGAGGSVTTAGTVGDSGTNSSASGVSVGITSTCVAAGSPSGLQATARMAISSKFRMVTGRNQFIVDSLGSKELPGFTKSYYENGFGR